MCTVRWPDWGSKRHGEKFSNSEAVVCYGLYFWNSFCNHSLPVWLDSFLWVVNSSQLNHFYDFECAIKFAENWFKFYVFFLFSFAQGSFSLSGVHTYRSFVWYVEAVVLRFTYGWLWPCYTWCHCRSRSAADKTHGGAWGSHYCSTLWMVSVYKLILLLDTWPYAHTRSGVTASDWRLGQPQHGGDSRGFQEPSWSTFESTRGWNWFFLLH